MNNTKNLYEILEVNQTATFDEIKKSYRRLAMQYHPDHNTGDTAEEKFKDISNAYQILGDTVKRREYDKRNDMKVNQFEYSQWASAWSFSDMQHGFDSVFGDMYTNSEKKPKDTSMDISITFDDSYYGCERLINVGYNKTINIKIPRGILDGTKLRINGYGQRGNERHGDLIVTVNVLEDDDYFIDNNGLHIIHYVDAIDAMLGTKSKVKIFDNEITFNIPKGVNAGKILRIRDKGFPVYKNEGSFTDLLINIMISVPQDLNNDVINLLTAARNIRNGNK